MNEAPSPEMDRRRCLVRLARNGTLGAIATASGLLLWRGRDARCPTPMLVCRECIELHRCGLPRARSTRGVLNPKEK